MSRRRTKTALEQMFDEVQLQGFVAKYDSMCKRCHEPILKGQTRVLRHGDGVMHVHCQSGFSDEG